MKIRVRRLVKHEAFFWVVVVVVLLNTVSLATKHYDQPVWLTEFQGLITIFQKTFFVLFV